MKISLTEQTKTPSIREIKRNWYLVDAKNKILGRLTSKIALILRGKTKPYFAPNLDCGDYVVVINSEKVKVTGKKEESKIYKKYSGYPGGLRQEKLGKVREKKPEELIYHAVAGMLPKGPLGKRLLSKLYAYPKDKHGHEA